MEYVIVGLLVALIIVLYVKKPTEIHNIVMNTVIDSIKKNEAKIVQGLYNSLPSNIKSQLTSKQVATIVAYGINVIVGILGETLKNDKSAK